MLTEKELNHIINLAHIEIKMEKKPELLKQLQNILSHVNSLKKITTTETPCPQQSEYKTQLERPDSLSEFDTTLLSQNAPSWENNAFKVPKIN